MHSRAFLVLLLFIILSTLLALVLSIFLFNISTGGCREEVVIAVYFYVWYDRGLGSRHWNDSCVNVVVDKPIFGYYSSIDYEIIEKQIKLIKEANIDVLFISWWGPGSYEDEVAKRVFEIIRKYGIRASIMIEPYLGLDPSLYNESFWIKILKYISRNYIQPYNDVYFKLEGKPLILAFNPIGQLYNPEKDFNAYTFRIVGNGIDEGGYQDWDLWPDYLVNVSTVNLKIRRDGYVAISPRFDSHYMYVLGCRKQDLRFSVLGEKYVDQWRYIVKNRCLIRIIAIYSWNEYHERSAIEPHFDVSIPNPSYFYEITKNYISKVKHFEQD